jgi:acetyl esterase/lipase
LDAEQTGQSYETNRGKDPFFAKQGVDFLSANFRGDKIGAGDPLANPLKADLKGFPPILLQAGADEALVDDSRTFAARAKAAGVSTRLEIYPDQLHTFQMMAGRAPEADQAIQDLANWVRPILHLH